MKDKKLKDKKLTDKKLKVKKLKVKKLKYEKLNKLKLKEKSSWQRDKFQITVSDVVARGKINVSDMVANQFVLLFCAFSNVSDMVTRVARVAREDQCI